MNCLYKGLPLLAACTVVALAGISFGCKERDAMAGSQTLAEGQPASVPAYRCHLIYGKYLHTEGQDILEEASGEAKLIGENGPFRKTIDLASQNFHAEVVVENFSVIANAGDTADWIKGTVQLSRKNASGEQVLASAFWEQSPRPELGASPAMAGAAAMTPEGLEAEVSCRYWPN